MGAEIPQCLFFCVTISFQHGFLHFLTEADIIHVCAGGSKNKKIFRDAARHIKPEERR
jgi:hypothetical protein